MRDATFTVGDGEVVALVGESGSGKSVTAMAITRLHRGNVTYGASSSVSFRGENVLTSPERDVRRIRREKIAIIFQDPMSSLNPVHRIGKQVDEALSMPRGTTSQKRRERVIEALELVGIPDPAQRVNAFPHELSGGQRQRVMIALALARDPALLIADEPTTALDVTIQAQILSVLRDLQQKTGTGILLITHDLGVVAEMADRVIVMYNGEVVESAGVHEIFARPRHPYTRGLLDTIPQLDHEDARLIPIRGTVPPPLVDLPGCKFHPRCPFARDDCARRHPSLEPTGAGREVRCWYPLDDATTTPESVARGADA
ncbi:ABC transporter ATP-binding protein [Ornithinimicrobium cryptoxanthini]|uniref:ABC transporter ATP-binding protein n=1 Tax=Ornithinimicrobium cryptoxanthini TaxID=2934161 RepID=UPI00211954AD|nr:ABC transporter ATP-binding protein [Ornithinimicrobium cryptoxanthini]